MSASGRECMTGAGLPKRRWAKRADAKSALRRYQAEGKDVSGQQPYRCRVCGWFHLGHYPTADVARAHLRARHQAGAA